MNDLLEFTPVPGPASGITRHDGWSPVRQRGFIAALARIGVVSAAAKAVGMSRHSAYTLRKRDGAESFSAAWDAALDQGRGEALSTAIERALTGVSTPIFYRGRQIGERRTFNDGLVIAALRATARIDDLALLDALKPEKWDD